jgi:hypothetical protein
VEPDSVEIAQRFARELGKLHQQAGRPSYATLERLSKHYLKRATVSDVLNGNRVRVPDWPFVSSFVSACRAAAEESRLDPTVLGSIEAWKDRWDDATRPPADEPVPAAAAADSPAGRTPGPGQALLGLPPRMGGFTGRQEALEDIRSMLMRGNRTSPVAIQGLSGIGKTQLAIEYAYLHADDYDLLWWVPCHDRAAAAEALGELAARSGDASGSLFETLRLGQLGQRWLLIFDDASDPDEVRDLLPPAEGHTLITTRNARWEASADVHALEVLARADSVEFLRRRLRWLGEADAQRLAEAVGDLPLLLEHAVEAGLPVTDYLERLARDPLGLLATRPSGYPVTAARAWTDALNQVRADSEDAWDLLCCLSFFGTESVSRRYLDDARNVTGISVHELLSDPLRLNVAIRALGYRGLLRVHHGTTALQVHRITQYVVRHLVAGDDQ